MSVITAGSLMAGGPINLVQRLIRLGPIRDLNLVSTVQRALKWLEKGSKVELSGIKPRAAYATASNVRPRKRDGCW